MAGTFNDNIPGGQVSQRIASIANLPASQKAHFVMPGSSAIEPAGQSVQLFIQSVVFGLLYFPYVQSRHKSTSKYCPLLQVIVGKGVGSNVGIGEGGNDGTTVGAMDG